MRVDRENPWHAVALVSVISIDLAVFTLIGIWLGNKLDATFTTAPLFLICGLLLGLTAGVFSVTKIVKKYLED